MEQTDYDPLVRHSIMLKDAIANLEKLCEFRSVAELEAVQSVIQQLRATSVETDKAVEKIKDKRQKALKVRQRIDQVIRVMTIPFIALVAFFNVYKNGQGALLISFCAIFLLLMLTLIRNLAVTFTEIIAIIAIGIAFTCTIYFSGSFHEFIISYSAEISAAGVILAVFLPWFTRSANKAGQ